MRGWYEASSDCPARLSRGSLTGLPLNGKQSPGIAPGLVACIYKPLSWARRASFSNEGSTKPVKKSVRSTLPRICGQADLNFGIGLVTFYGWRYMGVAVHL